MDAISSVLYPLPDSKLPQINLSPSIIEHWKSEARDIVRDVLTDRQSWHFRFQDHKYLYKPIYAKNNIHGCVRVNKRAKMIEFMSRGELNITLDELIYGLHCENNAEQRSVYAQLYQDGCLDGAFLRLYEGRKSTDLFHSVAVKWIAFRSPMNKIFHMRDFVYFEYSFTTTDADGRKVLIEFKKSKQLRPDQLHNHDLDITRGSLYVLNTYYMEEDHVVMHSQGNLNISGKFPVWFAMSVMPIVFDRVKNHQGLVYSRILADGGMTINALCSDALPACEVCEKKFKLMRGKKWCRGCGHMVCRDCVADVIFYKDEIESASRLPFTRERFCLRCLIQLRVHRTAVGNASGKGRPSCRFSTDSAESNTLELTASVHSMDDFLDRRTRHSMDESLLSLSMVTLDDLVDEDPAQKPFSRRSTRLSAVSNSERENRTESLKAI